MNTFKASLGMYNPKYSLLYLILKFRSKFLPFFRVLRKTSVQKKSTGLFLSGPDQCVAPIPGRREYQLKWVLWGIKRETKEATEKKVRKANNKIILIESN